MQTPSECYQALYDKVHQILSCMSQSHGNGDHNQVSAQIIISIIIAPTSPLKSNLSLVIQYCITYPSKYHIPSHISLDNVDKGLQFHYTEHIGNEFDLSCFCLTIIV